MKKSLLFLLGIAFCVGLKAQTTVTINATGSVGSFATGSVSSAGTKNDGNMITVNSSANRGWAHFDLSSIPGGSSITSVVLRFTTFTSTGSTAANSIFGFTGNPSAIAGATLYTNCGTGTAFNSTSWTADALNTKTLNATGIAFFQSNIGTNNANLGFVRGSTNTYNVYGYPGTTVQQPQVDITYVGPCTGAASSVAVTGAPGSPICPGIAFTLTATPTPAAGYNYQWQSSAVGAGSWTNITGATSAAYTSTANSSLDYRAVVTCPAGGGGVNSSVATVNVSGVSFASLPYTQGFESWVASCSGAATAFPAAEWSNVPTTSDNSWRRNDQGTSATWQFLGDEPAPFPAPLSTELASSARFHTYGAAAGAKGTMQLYLNCSSGGGSLQLSFDYRNPTGTDVLKVFLSTDGGSNFTQLGANLTTSGSWSTKTFPFTSSSANTVLRFEATSDFGNDDIGMDNLAVTVPPSCLTPSGLNVTAIAAPTATFSWTPVGGASGYEYAVTTTPAPPASGTSTGSATVGLTGLTINTKYYAHVRTACAFSTFSTWSTFEFNTTPNDDCGGAIDMPIQPNGPTCAASVTVVTTAATQSADAAPSCASFGYEDDVWYKFTATSTSHILNVSGFTQTSGTATSLGLVLYTGSCGALVQGGCLDPMVLTAGAGSITITGLVNGTTYYLRTWASGASTNSATWNMCIQDLPACPQPLSVSVGSITSTSASVTFTGAGTAYIVDYGLSPYTTPGTGATTGVGGLGVFTGSGSPIAMSGLTPSTTYQIYVRQDCTAGVGGYSANSGPVSFTTAAPPPANDEATGAIPLALGSCATPSFTNTNASQSGTEPWGVCSATAGFHTVWYSFVAPASGSVRVSTNGGTGNTLTDSRLALFAATNPADYSTFTLISCDEDGGTAAGAGNLMSVLYATGLTSGVTYYVQVDGFSASDQGTFCLGVEELTSSMISTNTACASNFQTPFGSNTAYTGWTPLLDASANLIALVRNPAGGRVDNYSNTRQNINTGAVRSVSGSYYLDRNFLINNSGTPTNVDVKFFYLNSELTSLMLQAPTTTANNIGAVRQGGSTCQDYTSGPSTQFLPQSNNGVVGPYNGVTADGNARWFEVRTPSFSNFYLQAAIGLVLPTGLLSFSGEQSGNVNKLRWVTSQEQNNSGFEVQRSIDGINYSAIGFVNSQAMGGNSTSELSYSFIDNNIGGRQQYYRLRQIDLDSRSRLSNIVLIKGAKPVTITIAGLFPNPAHESLNVIVGAPSKDKVTLLVIDVTGKSVMQQMVNVDAGSNTVPVDISRLTSGSYIVKLVCSSNCEMAVGKFVKQ